MKLSERQSRSPNLALFSNLALLAAVSWATYLSLAEAIDQIQLFEPDPFNGTFQLLNATRRIASDSALGTDYVIFHGPLWALLVVPSFLLSSDPIVTVHVAKIWFGQLALPLAAGFFIFILLKPSHLKILLVAIAVFSATTGSWLGLSFLGENMLGSRLAAGLVVVLSVVYCYLGKRWLRTLAAGFLSGLILLFATDIGLYAFIGTILSLLLISFMPSLSAAVPYVRWSHRIGRLSQAALIPLAGALFGMFVLAKGSFNGVSRAAYFYLVELPQDQKWFFGAWPVETIKDWGDLFAREEFMGTLLVCILLLTFLFLLRDRIPQAAFVSSLSLLTSALLSLYSYTSSYLSPHYLFFAKTSALLCALILVGSFFDDSLRVQPSRRLPSSPRAIFGFLAAGIFVLLVPLALTPFVEKSPSWKGYEETIRTLGAVCSPDSKVSPVWSLYPGLPQSTGSGCFSPMGDLAIHALGSRREEYIAAFTETKPPIVETPRGDRFRHEPWLRSTLFPLYWRLWSNYEPIGETDKSIFWRRTSPREWTVLSQASFAPNGKLWSVDTPAEGTIGVVTVAYDIDNSAQIVPFFGSSSGSGIKLSGTTFDPLDGLVTRPEEIPLDPKANTVSFAIQPAPCSASVGLEPFTRGLNPWQEVSIKKADVIWIAQPRGLFWDLYFGSRWPREESSTSTC